MTILESEVSVKKDVPEEEKEEMKAETNEEIRMEKGEFDDGDNKHISGAFETVTEEDILMEKGKLEDNGATYQSRGNKSQDQSNQTPNSSNLSMGAAVSDDDEGTVVSFTSLRRGEQLAHLFPVAFSIPQ